MAVWTANTKCMLVWRSGLQYQATIVSHALTDAVISTVRTFYESSGAVVQTVGTDVILFRRGKRWATALAWILPTSEKRLVQTITVSASQKGDMSSIDIRYDVRVFPMIFMAPSALVKEVEKLRSLLSETSTTLKAA